MDIKNYITNFKTKNVEGFTNTEINSLLIDFPTINKEKFYGALDYNTCMIIDNEIINYHSDVQTALYCGLESRNINTAEFD